MGLYLKRRELRGNTCSVAGRAVEEQLRELTRLVLRLPEVDAILQRAGLQLAAARPEPSAALETFVKASQSFGYCL